jgi:hypothetical protein
MMKVETEQLLHGQVPGESHLKPVSCANAGRLQRLRRPINESGGRKSRKTKRERGAV